MNHAEIVSNKSVNDSAASSAHSLRPVKKQEYKVSFFTQYVMLLQVTL